MTLPTNAVFLCGIKYLIRVTNLGNTTNNLNYSLSWYEGEC